jgi:ATP-dependent Clp protease ATP-binding subunit ClpC
MLERFTDRGRRVMVLATEEARNRRHAAVGPEHLLMGILRDGGGLAINVLERLRVNVGAVRAEIERVLADIPESATNMEPVFSAELRVVLGSSFEEGRRHNYVGTEQLLLGLLADNGSIAGRMLRAAGATLDEARRTVEAYLGATRATEDATRLIATSKWRVQI